MAAQLPQRAARTTKSGEVIRPAAGSVPPAAAQALDRQDWPTVRDHLQPLAERGELSPAGWTALADACWWLGDLDAALGAYEAAHHAHLAAGEPAPAAMSALLLGAHASERGEAARGSAWMARARRLLADLTEDGPEHGYPLYFDLFAALGEGDHDEALRCAAEMQRIGAQHGDADLVALAVMGEGRIRIKAGEVAAGIHLLDEAMLMALSGDLHPLWTGGVYCHLMDACVELQDLSRAGEWTEATSRWCDSVAEAVVYRGICRVHRAQVLGRRGTWDEAEREAARAVEVLDAHVGTAAEAHYELGELARRRGDLDAAEAAYRQAHALGRDPQPGRALVRADRGEPAAACASLRAALMSRPDDPLRRVPLAAALVEVALAAGETETARAAGAELQDTARRFASPGLAAHAATAAGAVLARTATDEPGRWAAMAELRTAIAAWQDLAAPHDAARCRVLLAEVHRALGDDDSAELELAAAAATFAALGAAGDLGRVQAQMGRTEPPGGLSGREVEVLQEIASGSTNRAAADRLCISEKTVARHLANIYTKLGVTSRAAATAWAVEHGVARRG